MSAPNRPFEPFVSTAQSPLREEFDYAEAGRLVAMMFDKLVRTIRSGGDRSEAIASKVTTNWRACGERFSFRFVASGLQVGDQEVLAAAEQSGFWIQPAYLAGLREFGLESDGSAEDVLNLATRLSGLSLETESIQAFRQWLWLDGAEGFRTALGCAPCDGLSDSLLAADDWRRQISAERAEASLRVSISVGSGEACVEFVGAELEFQELLDRYSSAVQGGKLRATPEDRERSRAEWEDPVMWLEAQMLLAMERPELKCSKSVDVLARRTVRLFREAEVGRAVAFWNDLCGQSDPVFRSLRDELEAGGLGRVLAERLVACSASPGLLASLLTDQPTRLARDLSAQLLEMALGDTAALRQFGAIVRGVGPEKLVDWVELGTLSPPAVVILCKVVTTAGEPRRAMHDILSRVSPAGALRFFMAAETEARRRYSNHVERVLCEANPREAAGLVELLFDDGQFDWASTLGPLLALPEERALPVPVGRALAARIGMAPNGPDILVPLLRAVGISSEVRSAAGRALLGHPELLQGELRRRLTDVLLPSETREILEELRTALKEGRGGRNRT